MIIDIAKLEKVKASPEGWTARCPKCAAENQDRTGNHLSILRSGKFHCVVGSDSDPNHNKEILKLVGLNSSSESYISNQVEEKVEVEKFYEENVIDRLVKNYEYFNKRNIPDSILEKFDCGLAGEGQFQNRFTFICRDIENRIIGFSGRSVIKSPIPWKIVGPKSKFIFPSKSMSYEAAKNGTIILVESIPCCLSLAKVGLYNTVCLFGVSLSQYILQYLISLSPKSIIISTNFDSTNIGQEAAQKIHAKLSRFFNEDVLRIKFPLNNKKDFNEMSDLELEKWKEELNG